MPDDTLTTSTHTIPTLALRPREAAKALGISERALWALTATNDVPHLRRGRMVLYPVALLQEWLAKNSTGGEGVRR